MLFNSFEFLIFLPVVFTVYWALVKSQHARNTFIVLASYVFYGWWEWRFLALIIFSTACSFASGLLMSHYTQHRKAVAGGVVIINLIILCLFKYFNFFMQEFSALMGTIGISIDSVTLNVILPVGISFYTFQALSYTIDVYRGRIAPTHDVTAFFAYISFFPQLVAGPIERASDLLPQFMHEQHFNAATTTDGLRQMLWGFFKKMVVADNCAIAVNHIWANYDNVGSSTLLVGAVLFSFQIYGDFSGYSDIAIGCAKLLGIRLSQNFKYPYFSKNIQDFWRRWHISLMRWFTDYIYIPLGGSRGSRLHHLRNIFIVFAISGLWHGANWTFIAWGIYHAALLCLFLFSVDKFKHFENQFFKTISTLLTFTLVTLGWIIFRAPTLPDATGFLLNLCSMKYTRAIELNNINMPIIILAITLMLTMEWHGRHREHAMQFNSRSILARHSSLRYSVYFAIAMSICTLSGTQSQFIYFQF